MSVLWDTSRLQPRSDIQMAGETITDIFWNAVQARGPKRMMREKKIRYLAELVLGSNRPVRAAADDGSGRERFCGG